MARAPKLAGARQRFDHLARQPDVTGGAAGAVLAAVSYLATRIYLQASVGAGGTGLLQYDSYYPLAFARELRREGHWFLFNNPFGTLDGAPRLFDGPATLARVTLPLWDHHLYAFDVVTGTLLSLLAGWWFGRLAFRLSRQTPALTMVVIGFVILGTGAAYVVETFSEGGLGGLTAPLIWASEWGLDWPANNLTSWEILSHAIFWGGLYSAVGGRRGGTVGAALALALLHPFNLAIYGMTLAVFALVRRDWRSPAAIGAAIAAAASLAWVLIAPAVSQDARFFHDVYVDTVFVVGSRELLYFLLPTALLLVTFFFARERATPLRESHAWWLLAAAAPLVAIGFAYRTLTFVPQPAHWTRVYPVAFIALAALALPAARRVNAAGAVAAVLLVAGMLDTAIANFDVAGDSRLKAPPIWLDPDERALVDRLATLPAGSVVYVRGCRQAVAGPELEYSIAALSDQKPPFGHAYFSPHLGAGLTALRACATRPAVATTSYVIVDRPLARSWPERKRRRRYGRFVLLAPATSRPAS